MNNAKIPKSSGEYNLVRNGETITENIWAIAVPVTKVNVLWTNDPSLKNLFLINYNDFKKRKFMNYNFVDCLYYNSRCKTSSVSYTWDFLYQFDSFSAIRPLCFCTGAFLTQG